MPPGGATLPILDGGQRGRDCRAHLHVAADSLLLCRRQPPEGFAVDGRRRTWWERCMDFRSSHRDAGWMPSRVDNR